jgi:hypothetical protein
MRLGLLLVTLCFCALSSACSGVDESTGQVRAVTLDPPNPGPGQQVRIYVDLYDPYLYPGVDGAGPRVTLQVDGGSVSGLDWYAAGSPATWEPQDGTSIIAYPQAAMYWTLPDMPGTYKLTVGFDGNTKTKRVEIK